MIDTFALAQSDRDAWPAIRGFTYQIDRTLVSWLRLKPSELLELEYGEDIDLIAPEIAGGRPILGRTLEQVKCVDSSITLRSKSVREALCNFSRHIEVNPSAMLRFRFFTSATAGEESSPAPLLLVPGITLWEQLRTGETPESQRREAIESIASFLNNLDPPSQAKTAAWQGFLSITRDLDRFARMIFALEWATGAPAADLLPVEVRQLLMQSGYATGLQDAHQRHDQLFVFVLRMLGTRGNGAPKRLDRPMLEACLATTQPTAAEQGFLSELVEFRAVMTEKFGGVESTLARIDAGVQKLVEDRGDRLKAVVDIASTHTSFLAASSGLPFMAADHARAMDRPTRTGEARTDRPYPAPQLYRAARRPRNRQVRHLCSPRCSTSSRRLHSSCA